MKRQNEIGSSHASGLEATNYLTASVCQRRRPPRVEFVNYPKGLYRDKRYSMCYRWIMFFARERSHWQQLVLSNTQTPFLKEVFS